MAIDEDIATAAAFKALIAIKHVRAVHIANAEPYHDEIDEELTAVALDDDYRWGVASSDVDGLRQALDALRKSHPGLVIDSKHHEFEQRLDVQPAD